MAKHDEHYIGRVDTTDLDRAIKGKTPDKGTEALLRAEQPEIQAWRNAHDRPAATRDNLTGLALSGGGIRSATFSLGVIQALVKHDLFKRFDYLSTVSGGGYIGSSITWLTSDKAGGKYDATRENFPYGCDDPTKPGGTDKPEQEAMLKYLRQHGNYLTPGSGISIKSAIAVVLRGIIVNFLVWLPIISAVFFLLFWIGAKISDWSGEAPHLYLFEQVFWLFLIVGAVFIGYSALYSLATWFSSLGGNTRYLARRLVERWSGGILWLMLLLLVIATIPDVYGWVDGKVHEAGGIGAVVVGAVTGVWSFLKSGSGNGRKGGGVPTGVIAAVGAGLLLYGVMLIAFRIGYFVYRAFAEMTPVIQNWDSLWALDALIVGGILFVTELIEMLIGAPNRAPKPIILLIGVVLLFWGAWYFFGLGPQGSIEAVRALFSAGFWKLTGANLALILAVALGFVVNLNYMTIHRYYRDRLMESFMPDIDAALENRTGPAEAADQGHLHELWRRPKGMALSIWDRFKTLPLMQKFFDGEGGTGQWDGFPPRSPYHIVNANLMLVNSDTRRYRIRGGDNFIFSPLYCGSNATGWRKTEHYLGGDLTLATAMAISGAAANPNTGVGGAGLTRNPAISILMGLLDIRLGYWVRRPRKTKSFRTRPNQFEPGFFEFINKGLTETHKFLQISDGGHFENLAFYELIRRRVRLIVCCDGGADGNASFGDLQVTLRRISADFGAEIEFDNQNKPENLVPSRDAVYPKGAQIADRGHIVGTITYADGTDGKLILLKTTLVPNLRLQVLGYRSSNPDFPDQTTADQFFDEEQFEAYRELGYAIASEMIDKENLTDLIKKAEA